MSVGQTWRLEQLGSSVRSSQPVIHPVTILLPRYPDTTRKVRWPAGQAVSKQSAYAQAGELIASDVAANSSHLPCTWSGSEWTGSSEGGGGRGGRDKGMKRACFAFAAGGRAENKWVSDSVR